jgi:triphosphoribosyl-dephospho-CoA synthase
LKTFAATTAKWAIRSLHAELCLFPKPGLVSRVDNGSHQDMDAVTFMRSLFSLRHYFREMTQAGAADVDFEVLRQLGIDAEARMLQATGGVNTHRGAIFCIGTLCAAVGLTHACGLPLSPENIRTTLRSRWGSALSQHTGAPGSHGAQVAQRYAVPGAREQAAHGWPAVFELALPRLQIHLQQGQPWDGACVDTLFALMAHLSDSNVLYRAGWGGMRLVQEQAALFLQQGGCADPAWHKRALACHKLFVRYRISPGGAADLFAATCFLHYAVQ